MNVGATIRKLREERNLTQEYIAGKLAIGVTAYGNIERNGVKRLTIARLKEIAEILKVHVFELFGKQERDVFFSAGNKRNTDAFSDLNILAVLHYFGKDKEMLHAALAVLKETSEVFREQMQENNAIMLKLMALLQEIYQHRFGPRRS
jgi:transcriptional regulator with XRE-family HTH domain